MRHEVEFMHSFTDMNGAYHENGYKPENGESLDKLL